VNILVRYRPSGRNASEISASVEAAIRGGELAPGDHLPPVRTLAQQLGVSPTTVASAYRELRRRGVTTGAGRGGTQIRPAPPVGIRGYQRPPDGARDLLTGAPDPLLLPALPGRSGGTRLYADAQISPRLRSLATEQLAADGIDSSSLAVTGGALDGIERVLATWLTAGDRVAVEDPGHAVTFDLIAAMGLVAVPVPVDDFGMRPAGLAAALDRGTSAVIFTPRAQAATGAAWDGARAAELRSVLDQHPSVAVIEDDHAGPVSGIPVHSVCGEVTRGDLARGGVLGHGVRELDRWVNVRSVSKSLGPDLRLAVLAGDEATIGRVAGRQALGTGWVSFQLQETVADLWHDPAIANAARVYAGRRETLLAALASHDITVIGGRSGMNCWIPVTDEDRVTAAVTAAGWAVAPGRRFRIAAPPGVRICFATLTEAEAAPFAADLSRALRTRATRMD
jgi:DNA-binding transcriptional MocR family regulator